MGEIVKTRALVVGLGLVGVLVVGSVAHAGYEDDKNNDYMGFIERALDKFKPDNAIFDGTKITAGASVGVVNGHFGKCNQAIKTWNKYEKQVTKKGKATDRFKKIVGRMQKMVPHCKKLHGAAKPYIANIAAKEQAAAQAKADAKATCLDHGVPRQTRAARPGMRPGQVQGRRGELQGAGPHASGFESALRLCRHLRPDRRHE